MKNIVVAYSRLDHINNHELMWPSMVVQIPGQQEPVKIIVHNNPVCSIAGDQVLTNYDFVVSVTPESEMVRNVVLERYPKPVQAVRLAACMVTMSEKFPNFMPVRTWGSTSKTTNDAASYHLSEVVIKHTNGARGICQLLVSDLKEVNKGTVLKKFQQVVTSFNQKGLVLTYAKDHNEAFREHLKSEFPYNALWTGVEDMDYELHGGSAFMQPSEYFMQQYMTGIESEYRVLVGVDGELHFFKRGIRKDRPFPQATGTNESIHTTAIEGVSQELRDEIHDFLLTAIPQMNSADLFLINTPNGMRYGIFEYCNQFGMDTDDPAIFKQLHTNFILHHARKYCPDLFV